MNILIFICLLVGYLFIKIKRNLQILQQNFYNENNRYLIWGKRNIFNVFNIIDIFILGINLYNLKLKNSYLELINVIYLILFIYYYVRTKKESIKIPLKFTNRIKRMIITLGIIYILPLIIFFNDKYLGYFIYSVFIGLNFYIILLVNTINMPIEKIIFYYYKKKTLKKLNTCNNLVVVGITGSCGKTSSKNILYEVLSTKYKVTMTPKNYNTLYGLMMTINNNLDKFTDIFIAEMGAFKVGSIKKLCRLVNPKYGIITNIGFSHLETFHTRENIQKGKFELVEALPSNGVAILNMDDEYQVNYLIRNKIKVIWVGIDNHMADVWANKLVVTDNGLVFEVNFKGDNKAYLFETRLLGKHNIYNILEALALGKYLGLSIEGLQSSVKRVKPIPHRLEIKRINDLVIIDDSYNSNPMGAKNALDVLKMVDGIKIVVTPGMIELGNLEDEYNRNFGKDIGMVADYVILIGKKRTIPIYEGLMEGNYHKENIFIINDIHNILGIINKIKGKKYVLLENDLPDIFSEN